MKGNPGGPGRPPGSKDSFPRNSYRAMLEIIAGRIEKALENEKGAEVNKTAAEVMADAIFDGMAGQLVLRSDKHGTTIANPLHAVKKNQTGTGGGIRTGPARALDGRRFIDRLLVGLTYCDESECDLDLTLSRAIGKTGTSRPGRVRVEAFGRPPRDLDGLAHEPAAGRCLRNRQRIANALALCRAWAGPLSVSPYRC